MKCESDNQCSTKYCHPDLKVCTTKLEKYFLNKIDYCSNNDHCPNGYCNLNQGECREKTSKDLYYENLCPSNPTTPYRVISD